MQFHSNYIRGSCLEVNWKNAAMKVWKEISEKIAGALFGKKKTPPNIMYLYNH